MTHGSERGRPGAAAVTEGYHQQPRCGPQPGSIAIGYSSLGLPLWGAKPRDREALLDAVLLECEYDLLELHLEATTAHPRLDEPLLDGVVRHMVDEIAGGVARRGAGLLIGLGGRHLLGPEKHEPSLIHPHPRARALRVQLIREAIRLAATLGANAVVFLSGPSGSCAAPKKHATAEWVRFEACIEDLLACAEAHHVALAPEAHSAHLFSSVADLARLEERFRSADLGFTADTAHLALTEQRPARDVCEAIARRTTHVQLDNLAARPSRLGLPIEKVPLDAPGVVDVSEIFAGLIAGGYTGSTAVEFIRHDHPHIDPLSYCRRVGGWARQALRRAQTSAALKERVSS